MYDYIKDLANGKSLIGIQEVNSFLKKLDDTEIHDLLYPRFENEYFFVESKAIKMELLCFINHTCILC